MYTYDDYNFYLLERTEEEKNDFKPNGSWFKTMYSKFNDEFFGGLLPSCTFDTDRSTKHVAVASCKRKRIPAYGFEDYGNGVYVGGLKIAFSTYFDNMTEREGEEVLLHEMIHIYQYTQLRWGTWNNRSSYSGAHGYTFINKMDEINKNGGYNITTTNDSKLQVRHNINDRDIKNASKQKIVMWEFNGRGYFTLLFNNEKLCKDFVFSSTMLRKLSRENKSPVHICSIVDLEKCKELEVMPTHTTRPNGITFRGELTTYDNYKKAIADGCLKLDYDIDPTTEYEKLYII